MEDGVGLMNARFSNESLRAAGVIAIIRAGAGVDLLGAARALAAGGVRAMEITLNTPGALAAIAAARAELGGQMHVGAGTILRAEDAAAAIAAGAQFIVTPTLQPDTIALCGRRGVPLACGCASPTEALAAHAAGAAFVKLFPATMLGLAAIHLIHQVLPAVAVVPTGGVTIENVADFVAAGAAAVAVGSALVSGRILAARDWYALARNAELMMARYADARAPMVP